MHLDPKVLADIIEPLIDVRPMVDAPASQIRRLQAEQIARAVAAYLTTLSPASPVGVRTLEWEGVNDGFVWRAADLYRIEGNGTNWGIDRFWLYITTFPRRVFDTLDAAKAAAQADYERRILAALEPVAPEQQEAAAWQRADDALASCAWLIRALCHDEIGDTAAIELDFVRSLLRAPSEPVASPVTDVLRIAHEALESASRQILESYQTWVADDVTAKPRVGQIPRYDQVNAAIRVVSAALEASALPPRAGRKPIELHIAFKGEDGPLNPRFINVETPDGKSFCTGTWMKRDGYDVLALSVHPSGVPADGGDRG